MSSEVRILFPPHQGNNEYTIFSKVKRFQFIEIISYSLNGNLLVQKAEVAQLVER